MTTTGTEPRRDLARMLGCLIDPALADLVAQLRAVPELADEERQAVTTGVADALRETTWRLAHRVVLVELHAARISGQLTAADPAARWNESVDLLARRGGWEQLAQPYPDLLPRLHTAITNRCTAG